ncbi:MAG: asparagine synthase (glutamine-hydrolyzing) [Thermogutta sp.]
MCGIAGAVWTDSRLALDAPTLRRMADALRHRGPDDEGCLLRTLPPTATAPETSAGLVHRRLSIIDLAGGRQPMSNEDGSIHIVFNGEIYNFRALRERLQEQGHRFRTQSDTEVLLHLYEQEGDRFLELVNGMFAFALWDEPRRRLILARDRLGEKPLVYRLEPGRLVFASELKALLAVPGMGNELDPASVDAYLVYQYVPHPRTIYRGICKLPPAHMAVYEHGALRIRPYWTPDFNHEISPREAEDAREQLRTLLSDSVRIRLESEVPLGAFLSGGIDSTIIVGLMQRFSSSPVKTFSIGFPIAEYDETDYARTAAQAFGTEHHEFRVEPDAVQILDRLIWHYDEPFADSSAIPTWYVSRETRSRVTVALTGDGGDELFAGYPRYWAMSIGRGFDALPPSLRRLLASPWWRALPHRRQKSFWGRVRRFAESLRLSPQRRYLDWIAIFNWARRAELYSAQFHESLGGYDPAEFLEESYARSSRRDIITATTLADLTTYLPCDLMVKVDIASMAHSLETRPPFLDHRVVELAASLPMGAKLRGRKGKRILLQAFSDLIPPSILRRGKMGFGVPLDHWFRGPLSQPTWNVLLDERTLRRGWFRPEAVRRLLEEHQAGTWNHSHRIWALLFFELWQRRWIDHDSRSVVSALQVNA